YRTGQKSISLPDVPKKEGYEGHWPSYSLSVGGITIVAFYVPIEYTATFKADGKTVGTVKFTVESETITEPDVPKKEGYTGKWETYTLKAENITVNAVYEPMIHYASCVADGTEIARIPYRTGQKSISLPDVPKKEGYEGHWPSYSLSVGGITIVAFYVPIEYTATFKADGKTVGTVKFTVETTKITEPAVPKKDGYTGKWETYTLKASDITVNAVYTRILPTGITLNKTSLSMRYKDKFDLKYTLAPEGLSGYKVVYKTSNASVAAVDATSGQVTAKLKGKGSAVITATVVDTLTDQPVKGADGKELSATCNVGVSLSFIQKIIVYVLFGWIWY
ncbi:MAG: InlB B-repeat-containing protein, partial [Clostridiales bacterium]|nr:InlB B-repeat-containing protein [Clostridiales bacterium]